MKALFISFFAVGLFMMLSACSSVEEYPTTDSTVKTTEEGTVDRPDNAPSTTDSDGDFTN
jgi:hypothetical protein